MPHLIKTIGGCSTLLVTIIFSQKNLTETSTFTRSELHSNLVALCDIEQNEETALTRKVIKINEQTTRNVSSDKDGNPILVEIVERDCIGDGPINCNPIPTIKILPIEDIEKL